MPRSSSVGRVPGLLALLLVSSMGAAIGEPGIVVQGQWSKTINESNLKSGPGSGLKANYASSSSALDIRIAGVGNNPANPDSWRVDVRRSDTNWHANLRLLARRTADGTGNGSVSGGTAYQEVTTTDQSFFTGTNRRRNIKAQAKVAGVSLQIPPDTYTTSLVLTIVDI